MNGYLKAVIGAIIGAATAGGWLVVDLLLPEPIGDYLLFALMGLANAAIGWQVGRVLEKKRNAENGNLETPRKGLKTNSN
ncbi:hypothetical protein [Heyndrickxia vini]|uniref:Uncharacterized protein n=1 Tax=Heyndrickxia vini TaxID=1476025 RepID=A0ABX7E584_9BACI|nr:hypothetical protein [Heyndrickxia vini]QQZ10405.1 hypothetical protein I5776_05545 [Heyndrickxia vini]